MTVQYIRQHECDFCVKFRQSALFLTQCCRKQRERKKWLTVRWRQRCSCLVKERLWRDACRSPFAHCDCKREKKQKLWELETCETAVHTLTLDSMIEMIERATGFTCCPAAKHQTIWTRKWWHGLQTVLLFHW